MKTNLIKLSGGGEVLHTQVKGIQGVHIYFHFNAGAWNDPKGKSGLAHFCEHVLAGFGTSNYSEAERRKIRNKFKLYSASTSPSTMTFKLLTISKYFNEAIDFVTDAFANVKIAEKEFERERKVIIDEILTRSVKRNEDIVSILFNSKCVKEPHRNSLTDSPAGTVETVSKITIEDVKRYMSDYLTLNNLQVNIVGNVSKKDVMKVVRKYIEPRIKHEGKIGFVSKMIDRDVLVNGKVVYGKAIEKDKAFIEVLFKREFVPFDYHLKQPEDLIDVVVSKVVHEMLFENIRVKNGLCYHSSGYVGKFCRTRGESLGVYCSEMNLPQVVDKLTEFLRELPKDLDRSMFERFRQQICDDENYDVRTLGQIAGCVDDCFNAFRSLCFEKIVDRHLKIFEALKYEKANERYQSYFKKIAHVMLVSADEKYADAKVQKEILKNLKQAIKRK